MIFFLQETFLLTLFIIAGSCRHHGQCDLTAESCSTSAQKVVRLFGGGAEDLPENLRIPREFRANLVHCVRFKDCLADVKKYKEFSNGKLFLLKIG